MHHPEITAQLAHAHLADRQRWTDDHRRRATRRWAHTAFGAVHLTRKGS